MIINLQWIYDRYYTSLDQSIPHPESTDQSD